MLARGRVLISALADICLLRYIEKTCQGHEELSLKIQFHNSNLRELSENVINTILNLKAQDFQKQYSKKKLEIWVNWGQVRSYLYRIVVKEENVLTDKKLDKLFCSIVPWLKVNITFKQKGGTPWRLKSKRLQS